MGICKLKPRNRAEQVQDRHEAILEAAFAEFSAKGFAATKVDDIARGAGVAKGTIYLHFPDKEALFEGMVRAVIGPAVQQMQVEVDIESRPIRELYEQAVIPGSREFLTSRGGDVIRLLIGESLRFPRLAEFYHREVVVPLVAEQRRLLERAASRGELANADLVRFPQLLQAPMLLAVVWQGMFAGLDTLDVEGMMRTYFDCLFTPVGKGPGGGGQPRDSSDGELAPALS